MRGKNELWLIKSEVYNGENYLQLNICVSLQKTGGSGAHDCSKKRKHPTFISIFRYQFCLYCFWFCIFDDSIWNPSYTIYFYIYKPQKKVKYYIRASLLWSHWFDYKSYTVTLCLGIENYKYMGCFHQSEHFLLVYLFLPSPSHCLQTLSNY